MACSRERSARADNRGKTARSFMSQLEGAVGGLQLTCPDKSARHFARETKVRGLTFLLGWS